MQLLSKVVIRKYYSMNGTVNEDLHILTIKLLPEITFWGRNLEIIYPSNHVSTEPKYRDEIYSLQNLLSRSRQGQAEQLRRNRKKFHPTTYKE